MPVTASVRGAAVADGFEEFIVTSRSKSDLFQRFSIGLARRKKGTGTELCRRQFEMSAWLV
jgi:hypothetical protein